MALVSAENEWPARRQEPSDRGEAARVGLDDVASPMQARRPVLEGLFEMAGEVRRDERALRHILQPANR
ncbi:MAG: hypothetical protein ACYS22_02815, partial [Planctomycetota bacterium]